MFMFRMLKKFGLGLVWNTLATAMLLVALTASAAISAAAQTAEKSAADNKIDHYYEPLPQETGTAGLKLMLRRLQTTARLMQVDAHPDDEDGGMLTLEARGKGVSTLLIAPEDRYAGIRGRCVPDAGRSRRRARRDGARVDGQGGKAGRDLDRAAHLRDKYRGFLPGRRKV